MEKKNVFTDWGWETGVSGAPLAACRFTGDSAHRVVRPVRVGGISPGKKCLFAVQRQERGICP